MQYRPRPLQLRNELHQKDLRINLILLQILGPENEVYLEADTFLALFLIVGFHVSEASQTRRRVDIPRIRPCRKVDYSQFIRI